MRSRSRLACAAMLGAVLALYPGCAQRAAAELEHGTDPKLSISSYVEEGKLVGLAVSSKVARIKSERSLMPLEVAVANIGLPSLTLTGESFTLLDDAGNRHSLAGAGELKSYGSIDADRRLMELPQVIRGKWNNYSQVRMNFARSFDEPDVTDPLPLRRFTYGLDILYFPRPAGEVRGKRFELQITAPELQDPIFVKFAVAP